MLQPVGGSAEKMVQFLQSSVGIIHKSHAESITSFVKDSVVGELKDKSEVPIMQATRDKRITFCVEGNISVGKSTFLQKIPMRQLNFVILWKLYLSQCQNGRMLVRIISTF